MLKAFWSKLTGSVPAPFLAALGLGVGFLLFVTWDQSHWWRQKEDYSFGWLVPVFVGYVVAERWPAILAALAACAAPGSPRAAGAAKWVLRALVAGLLGGGALLFLLGAFYRAGAGASYPGTLAITMGSAGLLFGLLVVNAPESASPVAAGLGRDARGPLVGLFVFPILIWFVSAPMVSVVENQLSLFLLHKIVTVVSFVFDVLGMPVEQQGNVLVPPTGRVGVEEGVFRHPLADGVPVCRVVPGGGVSRPDVEEGRARGRVDVAGVCHQSAAQPFPDGLRLQSWSRGDRGHGARCRGLCGAGADGRRPVVPAAAVPATPDYRFGTVLNENEAAGSR